MANLPTTIDLTALELLVGVAVEVPPMPPEVCPEVGPLEAVFAAVLAIEKGVVAFAPLFGVS